jgi:protein SCO1
MSNWNRISSILMIAACILSLSCHRTPERHFALRGKVISVEKGQHQVTLAHEEIKDFMDAMTMPFNVSEDRALAELSPGQTIEATLVVQKDRSWIEGIRIVSKGEVANMPPAEPATMPVRRGDKIPDFWLTNQDGKRIHISQYLGRPLLLTLIYTRCPIPDYCPRMSKKFSEIHKGLKSFPASGSTPHLLSISFDTEYDSPKILREYAARYMNPVSFENWEFATGSPEEINQIASYFGLVYRKESGRIVHSLVTALIGPDGTLAHLYVGNEWVPQQILAEFKK